jgi:hypothetical protein
MLNAKPAAPPWRTIVVKPTYDELLETLFDVTQALRHALVQVGQMTRAESEGICNAGGVAEIFPSLSGRWSWPSDRLLVSMPYHIAIRRPENSRQHYCLDCGICRFSSRSYQWFDCDVTDRS